MALEVLTGVKNMDDGKEKQRKSATKKRERADEINKNGLSFLNRDSAAFDADVPVRFDIHGCASFGQFGFELL
jgi:hypothetical protein